MKFSLSILLVGIGLTLLVSISGQAQDRPAAQTSSLLPSLLETANAAPVDATGHIALTPAVQVDPLAYLREARRSYDAAIRDYTCRLTKQELMGKKLSLEQVAEVKFREGPYSVFMHIIRNPDQARRILYVKNRVVRDGQEQAVIEPEGAIARLLVRSVYRPIEGRDARKASRRTISEFGFGRSLDLILKYAELSAERGHLDLRYAGEGSIDGRPTHIIERRLPKTSDGGEWPDALLVVHMDQEWRLPVACYSYADAEGTRLLGRYEYSNVRLNVGLGDSDFEPLTYGM